MHQSVHAKASSGILSLDAGDVAAYMPMSAEEQLKFLQNDQRRSCSLVQMHISTGGEASTFSSKTKDATTAKSIAFRNAFQWPNMPLEPMGVTSTTKATDETDATVLQIPTRMSRKAALAQGCKLNSKAAKQLTFVPMTSWLNNTGEKETENDGPGLVDNETLTLTNDVASYTSWGSEPTYTITRNYSSASSPCFKPVVKNGTGSDCQGDHNYHEVSISVSIIEQLDSADGQSELSDVDARVINSQVLPQYDITSPQSSLTQVQTPAPTRAMPPQLPRHHQPKQKPPRQSQHLHASQRGPSRAAPSVHNHFIRRPSDVAALLHGLLRSESGIAPAKASTNVVVSTAVPRVVPASKPACTLGTDRSNRSKGKKKRQSANAAANIEENSQDVSLLNSLARIISDRINKNPHSHKGRERRKGKKVSSLSQLDVNRAFLATDTDFGVTSSSKKQKRSCRDKRMSNNGTNNNNVSPRSRVNWKYCRNGDIYTCERPVSRSKCRSHSHISKAMRRQNDNGSSRFPLRTTKERDRTMDGFRNAQSIGRYNGLYNCELLTRSAGKQRTSRGRLEMLQGPRQVAIDHVDQPTTSTAFSPTLYNGSNSHYCRRSTKHFFELAEVTLSSAPNLFKRCEISCREEPTLSLHSPATSRRVKHHARSDSHDSVQSLHSAVGSATCDLSDYTFGNSENDFCSTEDEYSTQLNSTLTIMPASKRQSLPGTNLPKTSVGKSLFRCSWTQPQISADGCGQEPLSLIEGHCLEYPIANDCHQWEQERQQIQRDTEIDEEDLLRSAMQGDTYLTPPAAAFTNKLFCGQDDMHTDFDESVFVRLVKGDPTEVNLEPALSNDNSVVEYTKLLNPPYPVRVLAPESVLQTTIDTRLDSEPSSMGSSDAQCIAINDASKYEFILTPSITSYPSVRSSQSTNPLYPSAHGETQFLIDARYASEDSIDDVACEAKSTQKHSFQRHGCLTGSHQWPSHQAAYRRRSRIHMVEPLADAILHKTELPVSDVQRIFSSWIPPKFSQPLLSIVPIDSTENTLESSNQPISLFCHNSGSVITADSQVTSVLRTDLCRGTENIITCCARRVVSRISEDLLGLKCLSSGSLNDAMELLSHSSLKTQGAMVGSYNKGSRRLQTSKIIAAVHLDQFETTTIRMGSSPGTHSSTMCRIFPEQEIEHDLELLQVTSNLALRFRRTRKQDESRGDHRWRCGRKSTSRNSAISVPDNGSANVLTMCGKLKRSVTPKPPFFCYGCSVIPDFSSVPDSLTRLGEEGRTDIIVAHCPELVTNLSLTLMSLESDEFGDFDWHQESSECTLDSIASEYRSGDCHEIYVDEFDVLDQITIPKERTAETTDKVAFYSYEPYPLYADGRILDGLQAECEMATDQHGCAADVHDSNSEASKPGKCSVDTTGGTVHESSSRSSCLSNENRSEDLVQRRSYNSHSYMFRSATVLPGMEGGDEDVLVDITCQLTILDRRSDSKSSNFDESLTSDSSELVCA